MLRSLWKAKLSVRNVSKPLNWRDADLKSAVLKVRGIQLVDVSRRASLRSQTCTCPVCHLLIISYDAMHVQIFDKKKAKERLAKIKVDVFIALTYNRLQVWSISRDLLET